GIAILGAGIFAKSAHLPAIATLHSGVVEVKAVYSRSHKSAAEFADAVSVSLSCSPPDVYFDDTDANLDALLARTDISAVIVVLPITRQPAVIRKALNAGKHVLSEKPMAPTVADGLSLLNEYNETYKPKGLIWRVAENFEAEPSYREAARAITDGKIGDVKLFKATKVTYVDSDNNYYQTPWRTIPDYQGGFLLDGGVHTIAALRTILPEPLDSLSAFASLNKEILAPHDTINAIVRAGAAHGIVELSFANPVRAQPPSTLFTITGTKGWITVSKNDRELRTVIRYHDAAGLEVEEDVDSPLSGVAIEIVAFVEAVKGDSAALQIGDPLGALRDVAFIEAALRSNGAQIDLRQLVGQ
ncbi:NAD(P)-binding protein, partial [Fistulina hepatica ATCC 64428]